MDNKWDLSQRLTGMLEPNPKNPMALALPGWAVDALAKQQLDTFEQLMHAEEMFKDDVWDAEEVISWQHKLDGLNDLVKNMQEHYEEATGDYGDDKIVPFINP